MLVFRLGNFGRDTERSIELADIVSLRIIASEVDGFMGFDRKPTLLVCFDEAGGASNQTTHVKRSIAFSQLCQATLIRCRRRQNALGEFQCAWPGLTSANLISFVHIEAHTTYGESKMTKIKVLSAFIVLSATVATPVLAQEAVKQGPGSLYGLDSQSSPRGAYNQLNEPSYIATRARDRRDPANSGNNERDPSTTGGEDTTRRPPSS